MRRRTGSVCLVILRIMGLTPLGVCIVNTNTTNLFSPIKCSFDLLHTFFKAIRFRDLKGVTGFWLDMSELRLQYYYRKKEFIL